MHANSLVCTGRFQPIDSSSGTCDDIASSDQEKEEGEPSGIVKVISG